jgi:Predicted nucleotide-binding protein containing TIR-like domain
MPADAWLDSPQNELKWGVVERIERLGYTAEIFFDPRPSRSIAAGLAWSADAAEEITRRCHGAAIIGLPRWTFTASHETVLLPTEYCHYEGALAHVLDLPMLILAQENLLRRVVFADSFGLYIGEFPEGAGREWLETPEFETAFGKWEIELEKRRDVFFGYCGSSSGIAGTIRTFIEQEIGATVLDWQRDFSYARTILEEIEEARQRCTGGIFLFTKDDKQGGWFGRKATPRDNVVFEAGYFASAKGKRRVLIIREEGAKMPADLGGDIYASLKDRRDLSSVEAPLRQFFETV